MKVVARPDEVHNCVRESLVSPVMRLLSAQTFRSGTSSVQSVLQHQVYFSG